MKFEAGKKYKHISGDIFDCIFVTPRGHPVMKSVRDKSEGLFTYPVTFEEYVEPRSGTVFVNIYARQAAVEKDREIWGSVKSTKEEADRASRMLSRSKRIACVEVPWVEGQGL